MLRGGRGGLPSEAWRQNVLWGPAEGSSVLAVLTRQAGGLLLPCNGSAWGGRSGGWRKANGKPRSVTRDASQDYQSSLGSKFLKLCYLLALPGPELAGLPRTLPMVSEMALKAVCADRAGEQATWSGEPT